MAENYVAHCNECYNSDRYHNVVQLFMVACTVGKIDENYSDTVECVVKNERKEKPFDYQKDW